MSSVIVADEMRVRETPLPPADQAARPYSIGTLDITPAADRMFTSDERLAIFVQVINPRSAPTGKPDIGVAFRMFRRSTNGEESVGALAPQTYNETTLPPDFDTAKRHPIFAAVAVPLRTFKRGEYRLEVTATDRIAGVGASADVRFTVLATAAALLREAPPLAAPFRREDVLTPALLDELLARLQPARPSAAFTAAADAARGGKFAELIRDDGVPPEEAAARSVLRTVALFALGDGPASLAAPLQQSRQKGASAAAVQIMLGAIQALEGRNADAISDWEAAVTAGASARVLAPLVADALLRQGDAAGAGEIAERAAEPTDVHLLRRMAAARIAQGRPADALRLLNPILVRRPDDADALWLAIHATFAGFVAGGPGADAAARTRMSTLVIQYVAVQGRHATLAQEWAAVMR